MKRPALALAHTPSPFLVAPTSGVAGANPQLAPRIRVERLEVAYLPRSRAGFFGRAKPKPEVCALRGIDLEVMPCEVLALIGPSGCGKTTFLRVLNRMHDLDGSLVAGSSRTTTRTRGRVLFDNRGVYDDVLGSDVDVVALRRRVGMVFQRPHVFPTSIFDNVAFGLRAHGIRDRNDIERRVEHALHRAALWDEVRDRLDEEPNGLSEGQAQRLCIARALAVEPEVLLMDEPTSALDPIATARIEELIQELRQELAIVIVTHSMQQAARVSQQTALLHDGSLVEVGPTKLMFTRPKERRTEEYLTGRFG